METKNGVGLVLEPRTNRYNHDKADLWMGGPGLETGVGNHGEMEQEDKWTNGRDRHSTDCLRSRYRVDAIRGRGRSRATIIIRIIRIRRKKNHDHRGDEVLLLPFIRWPWLSCSQILLPSTPRHGIPGI